MPIDEENEEQAIETFTDLRQPPDVELQVLTCRMQLSTLIQGYYDSQCIDALDMRLLFLRLGLVDGHCSTLIETGKELHMSSENVRRRQYVILRKKIRDDSFFQLLKTYHQYVRLPHGIQQSLWHQGHFAHKNTDLL
ncbi:hypothetical protein [Tengunoibacter tsumagoiensis]|uniref:RNA polymerase sigma-70 region 4 domain-containing protein n=1 Tax=Tengunoibacter tsumagoiensis TaxID=2014871 RepID=A0A402A9K2_9CHLR|nr:hypothetical protein [Tengunoibacter tsumagoiensis]GCE15820.1 hypothetical protein KTT_56790 [Tengunoibacter tsumagoiensis]